MGCWSFAHVINNRGINQKVGLLLFLVVEKGFTAGDADSLVAAATNVGPKEI
jgi:hypothetical protein